MSEEAIEKFMSSTPTSGGSKNVDLINSKGKRNSNSVPSDVKRKEKQVPHYLQASTGSCHDYCKHGIQHSFQSKKWSPLRRAHQDRHKTANEEQDRVTITPPRGKPGKVSLVKDESHAKAEFTRPKVPPEKVFNPSGSCSNVEELSAEAPAPVMVETEPSDAINCSMSPDDMANCGDGESSEGPVSIELEMPLAIQESKASDEHIVGAILPTENTSATVEQSPADLVKDSVCAELSDGSAKERVSSVQTSSDTVYLAPEKHEQDAHPSKSAILSEESVAPKVKATLSTTKSIASSQKSAKMMHRKVAGTAVQSSSRPKTVRTKPDATGKFDGEKKPSSPAASVLSKVKDIKVSSPANEINSSAKPARLSKQKASAGKDRSPSLSSGSRTHRKMTGSVPKSTQGWPKKEEKAMLIPVKLSRSLNLSINSLSSLKMRAFKKEKSAYPIKNDMKVRRTNNASADTKEKASKKVEPKARKPEVNNKKENRSRKDKASGIPSNSAMQAPHKLTFRRGKVVNLQNISENNGPRQLRFRPAKIADDSQRVKGSIKGRFTGRSDNAAAARGQAALSGQVVILRHQDVKDKKHAQGLFNNVIEETASKLVETRKGKVKALVGAFETVISLQESKAAPAAAAAPSAAS